jgi:hypothetical protein
MKNPHTIGFVICMLTYFLACNGHAKAERKATALEFTYSYLAAEMQMPEICEKIYEGAYLTAGWGGSGNQTAYAKSGCYYHVAITTQNAEFCKSVIPKNSFFLSGEKMNEYECRERVAQSKGELRTGGGEYDLLMHFMGYGKDMVDGQERYYQLRRTPEFRARIALLPDFSKESPLAPGFSFSTIGCKDAADPKWFCQYAHCLRYMQNLEKPEECFKKAEDAYVSQRVIR